MSWKFVSRQFERWTFRFRWKIWGFTLKKIKVRYRPPCRHTLRKILKHQTEVDNNSWWLVPISFLYDDLHWNKQFFFSFFVWPIVQFIFTIRGNSHTFKFHNIRQKLFSKMSQFCVIQQGKTIWKMSLMKETTHWKTN